MRCILREPAQRTAWVSEVRKYCEGQQHCTRYETNKLIQVDGLHTCIALHNKCTNRMHLLEAAWVHIGQHVLLHMGAGGVGTFAM